MNRGWKKISSKIIHQNGWYALRHDKVLRPNGTPGDYFVISAKPGVSILVKDEKDRLYVQRQYRYPIGNKSTWEFVNGTQEPGESLLNAAKRELREETGILAKKWTSLGKAYPSDGISSEITHYFLAENITFTNREEDETEKHATRLIAKTLNQVLTLAKSGQMSCAVSLCGLFMYLIHFKKL